MKIRACNLENFRNIEAQRLRFAADRVFLSGLNGQGKSNLLEALGLLHALRSFRTADLRHLIRRGARVARLYFEIETGGKAPETALIELRRGGGREVRVNDGKVASLGDFLARFPCLVLAAEDIQVIRGAPAQRRRLLDLHFSSSRPGYYRALREYYRGLAARNRLLKNDAPGDQIRAHDRPLAEAAAAVRRHRREGTDALVPVFAESFDRISGGLDGPALSLRASLPDPDPGEIRRSWEAGLERDRALRSTQAGPHRDDWIFATETGDAREYASDGQQRNLAIALKLALFRDLRASAAEEPVLLADDILGELDPVRRRAFWDGLPADCQVIATGTEFDPSRHPGRWEAFTVEGGTFEKRHDS